MQGLKAPETTSSINNVLDFWYKNKTLNMNTILPVRVKEVNKDGTVDVEVMILGLDASNKALDSIIIYNNPVLTSSAGSGSFIITPKVEDIGLMAFCQRDISAVASTKSNSIPNSLRRFSLSDGIYLGALLYNNEDAVNKVEINDEEIVIQTDKSTISIADKILIESDGLSIDAVSDIEFTGKNVTISGTKIITTASEVNAITELKDVCSKIAIACSLPTAPGQPVVLPPDLILIQTALAKLGVFE